MVDITDRNHMPDMDEIGAFVANPLFDAFCAHMDNQYAALRKTEFSGESAWLGWNVKFRKAGRALCTLYPKNGFFTVLVVIGRREKERAEAALSEMSREMQTIYGATGEGMGQRWLMIDLREDGALYRDTLRLIELRRHG